MSKYGDEMSRAKTASKARVGNSSNVDLPSARPFLTGGNLKTVLCFLLAAVTMLLYIPVAGHAFVGFDDDDYVTGNSHIQGGLRWSTVRWAFTSTDAANWHPLTWLSHALDYQFFGLSPAGHHLDSVLIHVLNAVLLFLLLAWVTKRVGPSLLVASLFAVHPINVESVAWVAERKNVLSALFFLLAIGAYVWYAQKPAWRRYLLVAALFAMGLMAKPMVITLPFVLLLLDYWPLERMRLDETENGEPANSAPRLAFWRLVVEKVPLLFLSALSALITVKAQRSGMAVRSLQQFPLALRIENAVVAYGLYLWKMLWPARLAPLYPHPGNALPVWQVAVSALILAGVTCIVMVFRRKRYLPVGWFLFLGTLVPVLGLVQVGNAAMADRYAYIPLIGIFVMTVWGLDDLADAERVRMVWRLVPGLCVLAALGLTTSRQLSYWENAYTLWTRTLAVTDRNPFAQYAMGAALVDPDSAKTANLTASVDTEQKRLDQARQHYQEAVDIFQEQSQHNAGAYLPYLVVTLSDLASLDVSRNRPDDARRHYGEAVSIYRQLAQQDPDLYLYRLATTLNSLGKADGAQNRMDEARQHFEEALEIYRQLALRNPDIYLPNLATTMSYLGITDGSQNRIDEARQQFEGALEIYRQLALRNPDEHMEDLATTLNYLGVIDQNQNRVEEARAHLEEASDIFRKLAKSDSRFASDAAKVEASLEELENKAPSR